MRCLLAICAIFLLSGNALASGGIWCETEAKPAKVELHSGVTRGMGGALFNFEGKVTVADQTIPEDLRNIEFKQQHVSQYWFDGKALKLVLYRERDPEKSFAYVEVGIDTQALEGEDEEGAYAGGYNVTVFDGTDACVAPVLPVSEAAKHPHVAARGTWVDRDGMTQPAPAPRFSRTPGELGDGPSVAGGDTRAALTAWGVEDVDALIESGAAVQA